MVIWLCIINSVQVEGPIQIDLYELNRSFQAIDVGNKVKTARRRTRHYTTIYILLTTYSLVMSSRSQMLYVYSNLNDIIFNPFLWSAVIMRFFVIEKTHI
jgi:hypothetical protein